MLTTPLQSMSLGRVMALTAGAFAGTREQAGHQIVARKGMTTATMGAGGSGRTCRPMERCVRTVRHNLKVGRIVVQLVAVLVMYHLASPQGTMGEGFGNHTVQGGAERTNGDVQIALVAHEDVTVGAFRANPVAGITVLVPCLVVCAAVPTTDRRFSAVVDRAFTLYANEQVGGSVVDPPFVMHQTPVLCAHGTLATNYRASSHTGKIEQERK